MGISIACSTFLCAYILCVEAGSFSGITQLGAYISKRFLGIDIACFALCYALIFHFMAFTDFIFRWRWALALTIFVICIAFEISGSSIGLLASYVGGSDNVLFGISRVIRTDEWAVNTPMALSQVFSDDGSFSYFQDTMRATDTDMFCVYGQPVCDIAELFRPFHWGYLLFGAARGLSFFWCGRLIVLFMVSFEFAYRVLLNKSKSLSLAYALLVAFSSLVQWWFAVNALVEMLIFGQLALVWAQAYLNTESYPKRACYAAGIAWCLGVFLLTFYPAWQVPLAYVFLALLIALLFEKLPETPRIGWRDIALVVGIVLCVVALAVYVFLGKSWDTVQTVLNTAYPGVRLVSGGGDAWQYFEYPDSLFTPLFPTGLMASNSCETSCFFTAFPFCIVLPVLIYKQADKKTRYYLIALACVFILFTTYIIWGLPEIVARFSLLGKSMQVRVFQICSWVMLLLMFISFRHFQAVGVKKRIATTFICLLIAVLGYAALDTSVPLLRVVMAAVIISAFMVSGLCVYSQKGRRIFVTTCAIIALITGGLVNPVVRGLDGFLDSEAVARVRAINGSNDVWANVESPWLHNNFLASQGARTINSTNVYPQLETWKKLDPQGLSNTVYNRYAHITIELHKEGKPEFDLLAFDAFKVTLSADDLKKLGATKILSQQDNLEQYSTPNATIKSLGQAGNLFMYEVG